MPASVQQAMRETGRMKSTPASRKQRNGIQVISRAAAILGVLERNPEGLSLSEIATAVGLPRSTVQRIVDALDRENLVLASSIPKGVRLGPAILRLASSTRFEIRDIARPKMETLSRDTGETVDLAVFDQDKVAFLDQVLGRHRLSAVSSVGGSFPLHCSANGKAVLAALDLPTLTRLRKRVKLTKQTRNTIASWAALERELEQIRASGVAYDREENTLGICAVSMTVRSPTGELAAISDSRSDPAFQQQGSGKLTRALRGACEALTREVLAGRCMCIGWWNTFSLKMSCALTSSVACSA